MSDNEFLALLKEHPELWDAVMRSLQEFDQLVV